MRLTADSGRDRLNRHKIVMQKEMAKSDGSGERFEDERRLVLVSDKSQISRLDDA